MTQSLGDLLSNKSFDEPAEIREIKQFVQTEIGVVAKVSIRTEAYVVTVTSAAAAGALRSCIYKLQKQLGDKKRILIRIG